MPPFALPATDDTHYTERYMGMPDEHVDSYVQSSAIAHVAKLRESARLLIIHGLLDNNAASFSEREAHGG